MKTEINNTSPEINTNNVLADVADILEQYIDNYMGKVKPALKSVDNGSSKQQLFDVLEYTISNIKKLEWYQFGDRTDSFVCSTKFGVSYSIRIESGFYKTSNVFEINKKEIHNTMELAKKHCQKDFERRILENIISVR